MRYAALSGGGVFLSGAGGWAGGLGGAAPPLWANKFASEFCSSKTPQPLAGALTAGEPDGAVMNLTASHLASMANGLASMANGEER
jgi:hypothetical protein